MLTARLGAKMDSLLLSCTTLSFATTCRFIPAHPVTRRSVNANGRCSPNPSRFWGRIMADDCCNTERCLYAFPGFGCHRPNASRGAPREKVELAPMYVKAFPLRGRPVMRSWAKRPSRRLSEQRLASRSEEHTSELQSPCNLVCRLLLE